MIFSSGDRSKKPVPAEKKRERMLDNKENVDREGINENV